MNKNVILILVDQMRGDCLGVNGNKNIMTPFLDDLARDGINFINAHASNPSCVPARANILTGLPSYKNGFFGYCDGVEWKYTNTMVDKFNSLDYKTINIGKTHYYKQRNNMNFSINKLYDPMQIDEGFISDYHMWLNEQNPLIEDPAMIHDNNGWPLYEWPAASFFHPTEWTMRTAIEEIDNARINDENFFMQISFHRPHPPFDPPKFYYDLYDGIEIENPVIGDWSDEYEHVEPTVHGQYGKIDGKYYKRAKRGYYASITHIDYQVGRLIEYLKQNKMYKDTTIMFTSDHGEMLGDHNMFRKATPFRGAVHIPLILKNCTGSKSIDNRIVTHIDIMPTLLSSVDEKYTNEVKESINLNSTENRNYITGEHPFDRGWHYIITKNYKYIWDSRTGKEWCFDLNEDLLECYNIANNIAIEKIEHLRQFLVDSFISRKLTKFVENGKLRTGSILPAYSEEFNEGHS